MSTYQVIAVIGFLLGGTVLLLIGLVIWRVNPRRKENGVTGLMLCFASLGPLMGGIGLILDKLNPGGIALYAPFLANFFYIWEFFFPFLLLFALVFPQENPFYLKHPWIKYLIFLPHTFHFFFITTFSEWGKLIPHSLLEAISGRLGPFSSPFNFLVKFTGVAFSLLFKFHIKFFSSINLVYFLLGMWLLHRGCRAIKNPKLRRGMGLLVYGIRSGVGLYAAAYILPVLLPLHIPGDLKLFLALLAVIVGSGSVAWAVTKHQFLDVEAIVRQSLVYSFTIGFFILVYLLMIRRLSQALSLSLGRDLPLFDVAFIILAILIFRPFMERIERMMERVSAKEGGDYRTLLKTLSSEIVSLLDLDGLWRRLENTLKNGLMVQGIFLVIRDKGDGEFLVDWGRGKAKIDLGDRAMRELAERGGPILAEEFMENLPQGETFQPDFKPYLLFPLLRGEEFIGFFGLGEKVRGFRYTYDEITLLGFLSNQLAVALVNSRLYEEALEKRRLDDEMALARHIQDSLLPSSPPHLPDMEISVETRPCRQVGGDYFDFLTTRRGDLGIAIGDVSGKGMPAALLMSSLQASLRAEVENGHPIQETMRLVNSLLFKSTTPEKFVTLFYGELDPRQRTLSYCNAGHNYPLLVHTTGRVERLERGGTILGAFPEVKYEVGRTQLSWGDLLILYTDGVTEALNQGEEEYGEERLLTSVILHRGLSPQKIKEKILSAVKGFSDPAPPYDDLTIMVLKISEMMIPKG